MRKLSLDQVYGCSTAQRNSIIALPDDRVAFLAGSYLVVLDCLTNEQRYLSFSAIEYLYVSSSGLLMGIIDRLTANGDTRIHIYSTKPIDLLFIHEPDRFGSFIGISVSTDDNLLMILHNEPAYMLTIQEIHTTSDEQHRFHLVDLASVRVVHGTVVNRMTKQEMTPHVAFISFCPYTSKLVCATGSALFKLYEIDNQNIIQQTISFRAEFYVFTCHCWLDINSILAATNHGHVFWIHDGSIRSDIHLQESLTTDLHFRTSNPFEQHSNQQLTRSISSSVTSLPENDPIQSFKDDLFLSGSSTNLGNIPMRKGKQADLHLQSSPSSTKLSEDVVVHLDLFTSNEILPHFIVAFREYLLVFSPVAEEPFFQLIARYCIQASQENQSDPEIHNVHKMSYIFDGSISLVYLLTDRNQIFRYQLTQTNATMDIAEKHIYGFHAYNVLSVGLCTHKSWLITLGGDNWIKIFDYKDRNREILSKFIPDGAHVVTGADPYGFHICLALANRFQLHLISNYELRMIHQYETRNIRSLEMSQSGHLVAVITNNLIKIYSTIYFNLISQLRGHVGKIQQVIWCRNDSVLISCGTDGMIYIFNIFTGMREGEIITKQFRYTGIAATNDGHRIYAITSESTIKIFLNTDLEQEWAVESDFIPSAICLSQSERLLYVGMTHGIIRAYTLPFISDAFVDIPAHSSNIRRLLVSYDDQYLVSIAESAYILVFRQTIIVLNTISSQYQFSKSSVENLDMKNEQERVQSIFEYVLVTNSEFDEQKKQIKEIQTRIDELESENNLKLRSKQLTFSKHLNNYSNKFRETMQELLQTYEQLKAEIANEQCQFTKQVTEIEEKYDSLLSQSEVIYEKQMMETLSRIEETQIDLENIRTQYQTQTLDGNGEKGIDLNEIVKQANSMLQSKWRSAIHDFEKIEEKQRRANDFITQSEIDIDDEIESVKHNYEKELQVSNEYAQQLTIRVNTLRKRYNAIITRIESRDTERIDIEKEVKDLDHRQSELMEKLDHFRSIIKKKEDRIGAHDVKLHGLQQQILHVEKRKYVLDYKTKSLLERIEPIDQEIIRLKTNNQNIEQQLTLLKRQQDNLISREHEYQSKLIQSSRQFNLAKRNHQQIWKTVAQQKELIKKAFEYAELSCTSDTTSSIEDSRKIFRKFIEKICHSIQNEEQSENQLEIQGSMKEWNKQRTWLLNQLDNLTKYTEENKQLFTVSQREHRKTIAPFINQLRELHHLHDDIQKKIQKRLAHFKIKTNEQTEFLQSLSNILHGNENHHSIVEQLNQTELHIETRDKEIDRLASVLFRFEYSRPCFEGSERRRIQFDEPNSSTIRLSGR